VRSLWLEQQKLTYREDVLLPVPEKGQALIRVLLSGVCSTDLELVHGYYPFSGIPGHEFVGEVVSSPEDPTWIGKRVVGEINIACGQCDTCKLGLPRHCDCRKTLGIHDWNGVFAEYLVLPVINLHAVPDQVPNEMAVFTEPLAAAHEILEQTPLEQTDRVLIIGAGRLGLLTAMVIQQTGCWLDVVARHKKQQLLLENLDVHMIPEQDIRSRAYDVVVEATGSIDGFTQACKSIRPRGRIILKSTYKGNAEVNFSGIVVDEVTLIGSRCGSFEPALGLLAESRVDPRPLIDAVYPLEQGIKAFEQAAKTGVLKVLIQPDKVNFSGLLEVEQ
jgi:2-desacetyl-2-hydroxyethyl bacteriochlorophyllide A dehydrogenase